MHAPQLAAVTSVRSTKAAKPQWTAHKHVSDGRAHRIITLLPDEEKVMVGIRLRGEEVLFTIPWEGTVYRNADVRRRVFAKLG
jgi:hypothetical protein